MPDRTFSEDVSKIHTHHLARVMARLRTLALGIPRPDGHINVAVALRRTGGAQF